MHFETYRWEDHVPRKGGWKFNLIAGALALGLIATAFPEGPGATSSFARAAVDPVTMRLPGFDAPRSALPTALAGTGTERMPCQTGRAAS